MIEVLKAILFGIVEGVTEWLPVSSTGHLILLNEFVTLQVSEEFQSMFDVVIQLGAILAVIVLFFHKLNPFAPSKNQAEKKLMKNTTAAPVMPMTVMTLAQSLFMCLLIVSRPPFCSPCPRQP